MKTAIIQTSIWKDKKIRSMHLDTRMVFLCMITNPDRNCTRYMKLDEDYLCIQSGIDFRQLEVVKKQLEELNLIYFVDDWAIFADDSYVKPTKGKLSQILYEKDLLLVPKKVIDFYNNSSELLMSGSGVAREYINKDNNKDININKDNSKKEINDLFADWEEIVGYEIQSNKQRNRYACNNLFKKHGRDKLLQLFRGVALAQNDKYAPRISDFISLQSKLNDLIVWGKQNGQSSKKVAKI